MSENIVCNEQKHRMQTATSLYATATITGNLHDKTPHSNLPSLAVAGWKKRVPPSFLMAAPISVKRG